MRLLLTLLVSIAVALLPLGGMASVAHAGVQGATVSCHHGTLSGPTAHAAHGLVIADAGAAGGEIASGSEHHHHVVTDDALADQDVAAAMILSGGGQPMPAASGPGDERAAQKPSPAHCPHCGTVCHCVGVCGTACGGPVTGEAGLLAAREAASDTLAPAVAAAPRSWSCKPWPPPPRA